MYWTIGSLGLLLRWFLLRCWIDWLMNWHLLNWSFVELTFVQLKCGEIYILMNWLLMSWLFVQLVLISFHCWIFLVWSTWNPTDTSVSRLSGMELRRKKALVWIPALIICKAKPGHCPSGEEEGRRQGQTQRVLLGIFTPFLWRFLPSFLLQWRNGSCGLRTGSARCTATISRTTEVSYYTYRQSEKGWNFCTAICKPWLQIDVQVCRVTAVENFCSLCSFVDHILCQAHPPQLFSIHISSPQADVKLYPSHDSTCKNW